MEDLTESSVDLRHYVAVLRRQRWLVAVAAAIGLGAGLGYSVATTPVYSATAEVLVRPISLNPLDAGTEDLSLETEREVVLSTSVATAAGRRLGTPDPAALLERVDVEIPAETQVLEIVYTDPVPRRAAQGAEAFAEAYLQFRTRQALDAAFRVLENIQRQIDELEGRLETATELVASLTPGSAEHQNAQIEREVILGQLTVLENQRAAISTPTLDPGQIIGRPPVPTSPSNPRYPLNLALGLFFGLFFGAVGAFVRDRLDDRVRSRLELEQVAGGPVVGTVPDITAMEGNGVPPLAVLHEPRGGITESYRRLRTVIQLLTAERSVRTLMVTSPGEREGKTTTAANLAVAYGQSGRVVTVVSADLLRPRLHEFFEVENTRGFVDLLAGSASVDAVTREGPVDNVRIVPSGGLLPEATEVMRSEQISAALRELKKGTDLVILDAPPVLAVADAIALASQVDAVLVVAREGITTRAAVSETLRQLDRAGARVAGWVLTNHSPSPEEDYGDAYAGVRGGAEDDGEVGPPAPRVSRRGQGAHSPRRRRPKSAAPEEPVE
jgi:succinoglycan biosynthesis transport protein ExoP